MKFCLYVQLRNPKEVTTEEYNEFYKKTFNEYLDPLASSHFTTEVDVITFCIVITDKIKVPSAYYFS